MPCLADAPYDIVFFLLDDMRADQVAYLPETTSRLEPTGVRFDRAYVTTPLCCPERASFLSGGWYAHQTGVLTNEAPSGGATAFSDEYTLATRLQEEGGYTTALIGNYMVDYDALGEYVPPGWSVWTATIDGEGWTAYDYRAGSSGPDAPSTASTERSETYLADWQASQALDVLEETTDTPLFLYVSFLAPHNPHTPAPEDEDELEGYVYRGGAYEEADVSDKPAWIQARDLLTASEQALSDVVVRERNLTLFAADRAMADIIDAVRASDRADRTLFVLSSDNGMMWREHRLDGKSVAYEESARVPLVFSHPELAAATTSTLVAMNLDVAATVLTLAGLENEGEGQSLVPVLCDGEDTTREHVLLQSWVSDRPAWSGLVTATEKYIETAGGEREYYELELDPYEEESQHDSPLVSARMDELAATLAELRGLAVNSPTLPDATVGVRYSATLESWGGTDPLFWELEGGALPAGLSLGGGGVVSGTPEAAGAYRLRVRVTDSSVSPFHGGPQSVVDTVDLLVLEDGPDTGEPETAAETAAETATETGGGTETGHEAESTADTGVKASPCSCGGGPRTGLAGLGALLLAGLGRRRACSRSRSGLCGRRGTLRGPRRPAAGGRRVQEPA